MEKIYKTMVENWPESLFLVNNFGEFLLANIKAERLFFELAETIQGKYFKDYFSQEETQRFLATLERSIKTQERQFYELPVQFKNRESLFLITVTPLPPGSYEIPLLMLMARDITQEKQEKTQFKRFDHFMKCSHQGFVVLNTLGDILYANPAYLKLLKINTAKECFLRNIQEFYAFSSREKFEFHILPRVCGKERWEGEMEIVNSYGEQYKTQESFFAITNHQGEVEYIAGMVANISETKRLQQEVLKYQQNLEEVIQERTEQLQRLNSQLNEAYIQITQASIRDPLTGLYNRSYIHQLAQKDVGELLWNHFIKVDIDRFRDINSDYSYEMGDKVLKSLSRGIQDLFSIESLCARIDSNAFMIFVDSSIEKVDRLVSLLQTKVKRLIFHDDKGEFGITVSVGIYHTIEKKESLSYALGMATRMLYKAKTQSGDAVERSNNI